MRLLVEEALLNGLRSRSAAQPVGRQGLVRASLPGIGGRESARGREQDRRADLDLSDEVGGVSLDVTVVVVVDVLRDHSGVYNILLRCQDVTFFRLTYPKPFGRLSVSQGVVLIEPRILTACRLVLEPEHLAEMSLPPTS